MIDHKYKIVATNPCSGSAHNENDSMLFLAKDKALIPTLQSYRANCILLGCGETHIKSVDLLIQRVKDYQLNQRVEIPGTNTRCEIERCINGNNLT